MKSFKKRSAAVKLTPWAVLYPIIWAASLVFTQMLRNRVSNAFFWFVCIFPVLSVAYALIGRSLVQVYVTSDTARTEKNTPVTYEIRLINSSPFPLTRVEAKVSEPQQDGVRCRKKSLVCSLVSFGACVINNTVRFPYRGSYDIGVESVYVYTLLGTLAFRLDVDNYAHVTVLARKMTLERDFAKDMTDDALTSSERRNTPDISEPSDIKDYVPGDPIKSIHWKLTSKSQDIKVRKYDSVEQKHTYIFCDLAASSKLPEKTPRQIYESVKALLSPAKSVNSRKLKRLRTRVAALSEAQQLNDIDEKKKKNAFSGVLGYFRMKKAEKEYRKNVKRGMTKEQAQTVRMVDELIASTSRGALRREEKKRAKAARTDEKKYAAELSLNNEESLLREKDEKEQSELDRILKSTAEKEAELSRDEKLFGGRVKARYLEDHDEMCADAVIELTVALVLEELLHGNTVTLTWFDPREDSGISAFDISSPEEFDPVYLKLSTAPVVPEGASVASLAVTVGEVTSSKVKIVTTNIDPVSLGEIEQMPARLGGAGSGCSAEVLIISPDYRYEDPASRAAFAADAKNRLISKGISSDIWAESEGKRSGAVFAAIG